MKSFIVFLTKPVLFLAGLIIILLLFPGCPEPVPSEDIDQNKIFQYYSAEYNEQARIISSSAEFRFNSETGSFVELSAGSYVKLNDVNMVKQNVLNYIVYGLQYTNTNNFDNYRWEYKNDIGTVFVNHASLDAVKITLQNVPDSIHKSQNYTFNWNEPVKDGETVRFEMRNNSDSLITSIIVENPGQSSVTVSSSAFQQYQDGRIKIQAQKKDRIGTTQHNYVGGLILRSYWSLQKTFMLVP
jgi:hypothetical protein